jgi:hypothetical protein
MNRKIPILLLLAVLMLCNIGAVAFADGNIPITPYWSNVSAISQYLTFSGGNANCVTNIYGMSGTTKIVATFILQRVNAGGSLTTIATWSNITANSDILPWSGSYPVTSGYTYRLTVNAAVTKGTTENVSTYTEARY